MRRCLFIIFILLFCTILKQGFAQFTSDWTSEETEKTYTIAMGDYDNDGDLDILVGNRSEANRVYRNEGGGEFSSVWTSPEEDYTYSVAWGDYDNDGDLDILVGNYDFTDINNQTNRIYENIGNGYFSLFWNSPLSEKTYSVEWADFNNDGYLDFIEGNYTTTNRIYLSKNGTDFTNIWQSSDIEKTIDVAWGDYDNDGYIDFIAGNSSISNRIYRNIDGTNFISVWAAPYVNNSFGVAWGDYDNDGQLDILIGNRSSQSNQVYHNDGGGSFSLVWTTTEKENTYEVAWGDYDNDGDLDILTGNTTSGAQNRVYQNSGGGVFNLVWSSPAEVTYSCIWADYDNNGYLDIVVGNNTGVIKIYKNDIVADFSTAIKLSEADLSHDARWGDFDNDGDLDIFVVNQGANYIYRNDGGGNFTIYWTSSESVVSDGIAWGDYDFDGDLDFAIANRGLYGATNRIYRNDNGTFTNVWRSTYTNETESVAWGDYDNDGDLDLLIGNYRNAPGPGQTNYIYRNDGADIFVKAWNSDHVDHTKYMAWGDYDNDGDLDILEANSDNDSSHVYRNDGNGDFTPIWTSPGSFASHEAAWGDYDNDGDLDILEGNGGGSPPVIYRNDGGGGFTQIWESPISESIVSAAWGDYDNDGDLDFITGGASSPTRLYINDDGNFNSCWTSPRSNDTVSVSFGDYDNDGDLDILEANSFPYYTNIIYQNNYSSFSKQNLVNNATYISFLSNTTPGYPSDGIFTIKYKIHDLESDDAKIIKVEYSIDNKAYKEASVSGTLDNITTSSQGEIDTILWNCSPVAEELMGGQKVRLKISIGSYYGNTVLNNIKSAGPIQYGISSYQITLPLPVNGFPQCKITSPITVESNYYRLYGDINIYGYAYDDDFQEYIMYYGAGKNPASWIPFYTNSSMVSPFEQLGIWDTSTLTNGIYSLKIVAWDLQGKTRDSWTNTDNRLRIEIIGFDPNASIVDFTYPTNNQHNVARNTPIVIHFSDKLNPNTLNPDSIKVYNGNDFLQGYIDGSVVYNDFSQSIIFQPNENLDGWDDYVIIISSDIQNIYGIPLGREYTFKFRTAVYIQSKISSVYPPPTQPDVELGPDIKVIYSDNSLSGSTFSNGIEVIPILKTPVANYSFEDYVNTNFIATYTNISGYTDKMLYIATLKPQITGDEGYYSWYFITADLESPYVMSNYPVTAGQIGLEDEVYVKFNKSMNGNSFTSNSFYVVDTVNTNVKISGSVDYLITEYKAVFTPDSPFVQGKSYRARLTMDIKDFGGRALTNNYQWSFNTPAAISNPSPVSPATNSIDNILKNIVISASFNKDIDFSTLNASTFYVKPENGSSISGEISLSNNRKIKFNPDGYLLQNTWYTCVIMSNLKSTDKTTLTNTYKWKFKTLPAIDTNSITLTPSKNRTNISLNPAIKAEFSTNLETGTVHPGSFSVYYISGSVTNTIPADVYSSGKDAILSVKVSLPQNEIIYAKLNSAIKTIFGTSLEDEYIWSFKTLKPLPGTLVSSPSNGTTNVSILTFVEATFATNIQSLSINDQTFFVVQGTNKIAGNRTYDDNLKKITFTPAVSLSPYTVYTAYCTTNIKTVLGTSLTNNVKWWFRTIPPLDNPTNISPVAGSNSVWLKGTIVKAVFVTNIDPGTLNSGTYYIKSENGVVPGDYIASGKTISFIPAENLSANTVYTSIIGTGLRTSVGTALSNDYKWTFITLPKISHSAIISNNPGQGSTNVGPMNFIATISVSNNYPLDSGTVNVLSVFMSNASIGSNVLGSVSFDNVQNKITYSAGEMLIEGNWYNITITTNVKTIYGSTFYSNYQFVFKTAPPLEDPTNISPVAGSNGVWLTGTTVKAVFVTNIDFGTLNSGTFCIKSENGVVPGDYVVSGKEISFIPSENLSANTVYTSVIGTGLRTTIGTALSSDYKWTFTTLPNISHSAIISNDPDQGNTNAGPKNLAATIFISNQYALNGSTVNVLSVFMSNTSSSSMILGNVSFDNLQNKITYSAGETLAEGDWYRITVTTNVKTIYGSTFYSNFYIDFKVAPPYPYDIAAFSPPSMQSNVDLNVPINVTFYTDIKSTSVDVMSFYIVDEDKNILGGSRSVTGSTLTFTPAGGYLKQNTSYTVYIPDYGIDYVVSGKSVVRGTNWWFKTKAPMTTPVNVFPPDKQKNVDINIAITAYFGYKLDNATCIQDNFKIFKNGNTQISANVSYDSASSNIQLIPQTLEAQCEYTVILSKEVRADDGVSMVSNFEWTFSTGKVMDREGGIINTDPCIQVIFPQRGLLESMVVVIETNAVTNYSDPPLRSIGMGYKIGVEGYKLNKPVTIKIDCGCGNLSGINVEKLAVFYYNNSKGIWEFIGGEIDSGTKVITAAITTLGIYAVFEDSSSYSDSGNIKDMLIECQPRIFIPGTWNEAAISFYLPKPAIYSARIYNMAGNAITELVNEKNGRYGQNVILWDGKDETGNIVKDRLYVVVIRFDDGKKHVVKSKTITVLRK